MDPATKSGSPEVSVLLSCYNNAKWLPEAIDSVLAQSFDNFEFILVDDGSTDDSLQVMRRYETTDSRLVVVAKQHSGLTDSLVTGIELARGRWIARLDGDDICEPTRLADQLEYSRLNDVVLIGSGFTEVDADGDPLKTHQYPWEHRQLLARLMQSRGFFPHSSAFFDREVAIRVGSYNRRFLKSQDRDLWLRLSEYGRITCLQKPLVRVRRHSSSVTISKSGRPQFIYGTAAASCAVLRRNGAKDPSAACDAASWDGFLDWMSEHELTKQAADRRRIWGEIRSQYFAEGGGWSGMAAFMSRLLRSGSALQLVREKLAGSPLPEYLAEEWNRKSCAAS